MIAKLPIELPIERIGEFCRKWKIGELALFGSVLRQDFRPDSDVDVLVTFAAEARHSVFDLIRMKNELKAILGREIDLVDKRVVEESDNYIRRDHILNSAEIVYGA